MIQIKTKTPKSTREAKVKPVSSTEPERQQLLHRLWLAQTTKLVEKLEQTPATEIEAATLNVARQVLSDNGVASDTIMSDTGGDKHTRTLKDAMRSLPNPDSLMGEFSFPAPDFEKKGD